MCIAVDATTNPMTETSGEPTTADPTTETDTTDPSETTTDDPTEEPTTVGPGCEADAECTDPSQPYCSEGACVGCGDLSGSCADIAEETPVCDAGSGVCVACTEEDDSYCSADGLICNGATNACETCSEHNQCASGACDIANGECFPGNVVWVDKTAECAGATGTPNSPFCEIADAIPMIGANTPTIVWVRPTGIYSKPTSISNRIVAILRAPEDNGRFSLQSSSVDSPLQLLNGARVYVENANVTSYYNNAPAPSVACSGSELWLTGVHITGGQSQGISADDCTSNVSRSSIYDNHRGGVEFDGGSAHIVNSFIVGNGGSQGTPISGARLSGGVQASFVYTTIVNNLGFGPVNPDVIHCDAGVQASVRNSILLGQGYTDLIECDGLQVEKSVVDDSDYMGNGNKTYDHVVSAQNQSVWFVNPDNGDYHLTPQHDFSGVAVWSAGDPAVDFDGDPRPNVDMQSDLPGADVPG